ncbi:MAG TPA: phytanoyl-CoA dioxygenase family protein [Casimicrobiaceae bacterium]|jgi:ectoine hydroxylase-related dioxygenase (phytanoyl-CoA dioxygenase family)|nr:phytanoyl-CoA dioxygenase family protein [Casimicrobiaceae bacterium]
MLAPSEKKQLDELGYLVLPGFVPPPMLAALRDRVEALWEQEGSEAGSEFRHEPGARRLANLVDKGAIFAEVVSMPKILECVEHVIGPSYKLSSLNARSTNPNSEESQPWHADSAAIADERGYWVCNSIWMLDDFTAENGATRMIPRSHTWRRLPEPGDTISRPDEELVTGTAGTVVIMNTHMWHGGTANRTGRCRRALHGFYTRGDKPQQQYQKALLRPETVAALTPLQRRVLAIDDAENDRLSAATTRVSGFLK